MQHNAGRQKRVLTGLMAAVVLAGSNFMGETSGRSAADFDSRFE